MKNKENKENKEQTRKNGRWQLLCKITRCQNNMMEEVLVRRVIPFTNIIEMKERYKEARL
jgi:hypothetical protein